MIKEEDVTIKNVSEEVSNHIQEVIAYILAYISSHQSIGFFHFTNNRFID